MGTRRRGRPSGAAALLAGLAVAGLTASCGTAATSASGHSATGHSATGQGTAGRGAATGTITEDGSSLLAPLMQIWATRYQQQFPGMTITVGRGGSTKGIDDATSGAVSIGASDAYLSSGDLLSTPSLLNIPLAVSAQSVIYNLPGLRLAPGSSGLQLTGAVLAQMYRGTIRTWDDPQIQDLNLGATIPAIPIVPVHRTDGSGDTFLFTSYLSTQSPDWARTVGYGTLVSWPATPASVADTNGSTGMYQACNAMPGCVGYNGVSYRPYERHLGEAALQNGAGRFATASPQSIQSQVDKFIAITPANETIAMIAGPGGYPLVNYEYAIVNPRRLSRAQATLVRNFLHWVVTTGNATSLVGQVDFQPLPADVQTLSENQIGEVR